MSTTTPARDLDGQIAAIRTRLATAQRTRLRAEAERDAAQAAAEQARQQLVAEFGVTTVADAQAMLSGLETELAGQLEQIRAALDEAGL